MINITWDAHSVNVAVFSNSLFTTGEPFLLRLETPSWESSVCFNLHLNSLYAVLDENVKFDKFLDVSFCCRSEKAL